MAMKQCGAGPRIHRSLRWMAFSVILLVGACWSFDERYIIVVDAGSTGSRLFVYWINGKTNEIQEFRGQNVNPGISSFATNLTQVADYMFPLFEHAKTLIPEEHHAQTLVYVKGTAGMRLLSDDVQSQLYDSLVAGLDQGTISGDMEGYYAAVTANFLGGRINASLMHVPGKGGLLGAMDMGGSSTQVLFHTRPDVLAHAPLRIEDFWVRSFLSFGTEQLRNKIFNLLHPLAVDNGLVENPCGFAGHQIEWGESSRVVLVGSGNSSRCMDLIKSIVFPSHLCKEEHCLADKIAPRPIQGEMIAMSNFYYAIHCVHELGGSCLAHWPQPTINEMIHATEQFCSLEWSYVQEHLANKHAFTHSNHIPHRCLEALYIGVLLRDGYGIAPHERAVNFALEMSGMEVGWTLGFALAMNNYKQQKLERWRANERNLAADGDATPNYPWTDTLQLSGPGLTHALHTWQDVVKTSLATVESLVVSVVVTCVLAVYITMVYAPPVWRVKESHRLVGK